MFDGWRFGDGVNNGVEDDDDFGYVETDPTGRYGRFNDVLGKGATKTVYRAFDEVAGMEVAWNQVRVVDVMRSPEELQRLYSEMHLLRTLDHDSVIKMYASWIDPQTRTINFITEMFTSGTLRGYRKKYKHVGMRVIKNWSRQILRGLVYLHTHDPPIIHRDLKCDNIFVNGHLGEVKVGDLGLAAILHQTHAAHSVIGTPEFMAPELYEEEYNELVDIYSFGMCVLEMLTSEYPYAECTNPAQIYKKVTSGKKPAAFLRIEDPEARRFVGRCLESAPNRATAEELLQDSFLASDDEGVPEYVPATPRPRSAKKPATNPAPSLAQVPAKVSSTPTSPTAKPKPMQAKQATTTGMTVTGNLKPDDDDTIFLTFQIGDKHGCIRNVHFPFDTVKDTPMEVAVEMVKELEISDRDASEIAAMIETEIIALVPNLKVDLCEVDQDSVAFEYDSAGEDSSSFAYSEVPSPRLFSEQSPRQVISDPRTPKYQKSVIDWLQDQPDTTDEEEDKSSQSSNFSGHYSNWSHISSNNETAAALFFEGGEFGGVGHWPTPSQKAHDLTVRGRPGKSSRFYPGGVDIPVTTRKCNIGKPSDPASGRSMTDGIWSGHNGSARTRSSVDYGSQFSQVSLLDEMKRQRMYKTIGAVEGIGYREPIGVHGAWGHATSWFSGRSQRQHRFA